MGLQNQLSDVSSESILVLATVLVARGVSYLHSLLFTILRILGFYHHLADTTDVANHYYDNPRFHTHHLHDVIVSGLSGLILMCEQIILNRVYSQHSTAGSHGEDQCVVCLNGFSRGENVRTLECCHEFHRDCLEGWLEQLNFTCPLCRKPLVAGERVECTRTRVSEEVLTWFQ